MAKKRKSDASEVYNVERIADKRVVNGVVEYFLKWEGYPESENTWENSENVFCVDLIRQFEDSRASHKKSVAKGSPVKKRTEKVQSSSTTKLKENSLQPNRWEAYVEEVINVEREENGDLTVHLKWNDGDITTHPSTVTNCNCPQKVLKFYEDHLKFKDEE